MENESFEDEEAAEMLNSAFICIKVDREERPDIDSVYMSFCQMATGQGGWPLTVMMTPEKKPFFAGTYFPKESRLGRPGLIELVPRISQIWKEKRETLISSSDQICSGLVKYSETLACGNPAAGLAEKTFDELSATFDSIDGGFGDAPKFPSPHKIIFLLRHWKISGKKEALEMAEKTLDSMCSGGIYDHIGLGIHRYSTDDRWMIPHFEKMLYDQALVSYACAEAYHATKNEKYRITAEEIFTYVLRELKSPEGAFWTAQDADSEGKEGKFYLWTKTELESLLTKNEFKSLLPLLYPSPENPEEYIVLLPSPSKDDKSCKIKDKLFKIRSGRVPPLTDTKILADQNGLMIAALASAGKIFRNPLFVSAAEKASSFILQNLRNSHGELLHCLRGDGSAIPGMLDDYAFMTWALIELFEATNRTEFLPPAIAFTKRVIDEFKDTEGGGFFLNSKNAETLIIRPKMPYDGAIPSGNSIMVQNLFKLSALSGDTSLHKIAFSSVPEMASRSPSAFAMLIASLISMDNPVDIVVAGKEKSPETIEIFETIRKLYCPGLTVILRPENRDGLLPDICKIAKWTAQFAPHENSPAIHLCRNSSCSLPETDIEKIIKSIQDDGKNDL